MNDLVTLIANVSLALSFIAALIFGIAQVKASARDRRERFTLETLRAFTTREFCELMTFVGSTRFPKSGEESRALTGSDNVMFLQFSQMMESLGFLVAEAFIDVELVDKVLGNYVVTSWEKYKVIIIRARERDPYLNEYFEWLAKRMAERFAKEPREPFYDTGAAYPRSRW